MNLQETIQDAVAEGIVTVIGEEINDIIVKEVRRVLRDHEEELTKIIKAAVAAAFAEILNTGAK